MLKILIPTEIKKFKIIENRQTDEVQHIQSHFYIYVKKFSDTSEQYKFCDTVRGNMPIVGPRTKSSSHFITDIQEDEMKLLVKNRGGSKSYKNKSYT